MTTTPYDLRAARPTVADDWHQHPYFTAPTLRPLFLSEPSHPLREDRVKEHASIVVGSDLVLSVQSTGDRDLIVLPFDGDGNVLADEGLARFRTLADALTALPIVADVARQLFPNHLLMPVDAQ